MLEREQPDLVVCTHGFPSFLISRLKEKGRVKIPVVNVYTDFFINSVWGTNAIDYHCVADEELKKKLIEEQAIPPERVFVTGIPIDEVFTATGRNTPSSPYHVLISGGSNGLGSILDFLQYVSKGSSVRYSVLCGSNTKLYEEINSWGVDQIRPLPYIHSREQMNRLYASVDAIVTKPGGVTVSEALANRLPIFINSALPGQEEINRAHLVSQGLVYELNTNQPYEEQLLRVLNNRWELGLWQKRVEEYHQKKDISAREIIVGVLTGLRSAIC